jgi:hypothetical protein
MNRQGQQSAAISWPELQVRTFGNDALVPHQTLEAVPERATGHQCIADYMHRAGAHHLCQIQADRRVAGHLHCALPEPGHAVLGKPRIGIAQCGVVEPQLD